MGIRDLLVLVALTQADKQTLIAGLAMSEASLKRRMQVLQTRDFVNLEGPDDFIWNITDKGRKLVQLMIDIGNL